MAKGQKKKVQSNASGVSDKEWASHLESKMGEVMDILDFLRSAVMDNLAQPNLGKDDMVGLGLLLEILREKINRVLCGEELPEDTKGEEAA